MSTQTVLFRATSNAERVPRIVRFAADSASETKFIVGFIEFSRILGSQQHFDDFASAKAWLVGELQRQADEAARKAEAMELALIDAEQLTEDETPLSPHLY